MQLLKESCAASSLSACLGKCLSMRSWALALHLTCSNSQCSCLHRYPGNHLIDSPETLFPHEDHEFVFQHDLASDHTAKKAQEFLQPHNIPVPDSSSNSLDLNVIEFVWQVMKKWIQEDHPHTIKELKATLHEVWESSIPKELDETISCMSTRIQAVIKSKDDATQYWLVTLAWLTLLYLFLLYSFMNKVNIFFLDW